MDALTLTKDEVRAQLDLELQQQVDDMEAQSNKVINEWQERILELDAAAADLEQQLEAQKAEATDAILDWQETYLALERSIWNRKRNTTHSRRIWSRLWGWEQRWCCCHLLKAMRELELIMTRTHLLK